jgi:hypothetical protein
MRDVRINKWLDFLDRVGWTAIQAACGAIVVVLTSNGVSWEEGAKMVGVAVAIAVVKVIAAQRAGTNDLGAAVPGQVLEEAPAPTPTTLVR